jgi:hypothetical protein
MKPQNLTIMKASAATLSLCTASTLMDVDHRRIERRIMVHHHNKQTRGPLTRDLINTTKEVDQLIGAAVMAKARIQLAFVLHVPRQ